MKRVLEIIGILSVSCLLHFGCGNNDDKVLRNGVRVIDVDGLPVSGQLVTLFDQTIRPWRRAESITNEQGVAILEYSEIYLPSNYDYAFIINGSSTGDPCGYVPFSGPDIDHTIVVDREEIITIEILNHDFESEQFSVNDTILIDMIFHSTTATSGTYRPRFSSPFAYLNILGPDGSYVDHRALPLDQLIKNDGSFSFQFIPLEKNINLDFRYRTKENEPVIVLYSLNIQ